VVHPSPDDEVELEQQEKHREPLLHVQGPETFESRGRLPPGGFAQEKEHRGPAHEDPEDREDPMVERDRTRGGGRTGPFGLNWRVFSQTVADLF